MHEKILRKLDSIGKRCFINCFESAWNNNGEISRYTVIECDPDVGRDEDGLAIRISCIRWMFKNKKQCSALEICCNTKRLKHQTFNKAQELRDRFCR